MKKEYHHGNLKEKLIETGIEMVQKDGIEKLSLRKLATSCGVSEAAPYKHFKGKVELLEAMQSYVTEQFLIYLKKAVKESEDPMSPRAILNMGKAYILFFRENKAYYNFLFGQSTIQIDLTSDLEAQSFAPFQYYKEQAYSIYRKAGLAEEKIKYGVIGMWAKVHGMAAIISMDGVTKDFEWEKALEAILTE